MTQELDKISQFLGTATGVTPPERKKPTDTDLKDLTKSLKEQQQSNFEKDYGDARSNLKEMIDESMSLLPDIVRLTREAQSSGMYLAASAYIKMLAELNKDLLGISHTKDSAVKPSVPAPVDNTKSEGNTTVFIGTSEEVFRQFSKRKQVQDGEFVVVTADEPEKSGNE